MKTPANLPGFWASLKLSLEADQKLKIPLYLPEASQELAQKIDSPDFQSYRDPDGHVTGSALVIDESRQFMLLILHPRVRRWLQPGGHVDPGEVPFEAAARETLEECGIGGLKLITEAPIDIDVHPIPAGKDPAHKHYDLRYVFEAPVKLDREDEWTAELPCRWVNFRNIERFSSEESVLRLVRKGEVLGRKKQTL